VVQQGRVPYHEHDDSDIRLALAHALGEQRSKRWRNRLLAYLFVVAVIAGVFWQQDRTTDRLCIGAAENRVAIRGVVEGVGDLGRELILAGATQPSTPEQGAALNRVDQFVDTELKRLELPICE
jgi:hypothetical protein